MNTIKHTPGPWLIQPEQGGAFTIWAGETQLGEVQPDDMGSVLPAEANARLIAEAPAMLAALRWAERFLAGFEGDDDQGIDDDLAEIRAILARIDDTPAAQPAENGPDGHCIHCGRDNRGHEGEPCSDDCPMYGEGENSCRTDGCDGDPDDGDGWDGYCGSCADREEDEPCPINRRPKGTCPDGCNHGEG